MCEISSFQLAYSVSFRPDVAVVLNVVPDHLDWHGSFEEYVRAKRALVSRQGPEDYAVLNADCGYCREFARFTAAKILWLSREKAVQDGVFLDGKMVEGRLGGSRMRFEAKEAGVVNIYNCMALAACGLIRGAGARDVVRTLRGFEGLEHRREPAGEVGGVLFFNDSKATNTGAFIDGLDAFGDDVVLISGGRDKGADFSILKENVRGRVRKIVLMGESARRMETALGGAVACVRAGNMRSAVREAFKAAGRGRKVLFLPACASFDMFRDYRERGELFKSEVVNLGKERRISGG